MSGPALPAFTWLSPTRVVFGVGALGQLASLVDETAGPGARVFLVTGRKSLQARGLRSRVVEALGPQRVSLFDQVPPFPAPDVVERALAVCRDARPAIVVAIGGGSVMDVAKSAAILMTHEGTAREFATTPSAAGARAAVTSRAADAGESRPKSFERPGLAVVAVPTTSGSSSEVTPFAALWDFEAKRSMHLAGPFLFPRIALVDPELAMSMDRELAAATGMDALTSAFESYWSLEAEPASDALNLEVIRLLGQNLERSCADGDLPARSACALAATLAGIAYSNSRPNVCHAVSSPLTLFWGVAHGRAVGITLPAFLRWNAPAIAPKLPALWRALGVESLDDAIRRIARLMERCGLEARLRGLGVGAGDVETLVEHMRWDRVTVLPRPLGRADARAILQELL